MGAKKRILHVVTAPSWRGGEQQVAYLLEELKDKVDNFVLCSEGSEMEKHCIEKGIDHHTCIKKGSLDFAYAKTIRNLCRKWTIDLCHLHDAHAHTFAILATTIYGNKTPLILSRRVDFPIKNSLFSKYKYNHSAIQKILCVSNAIKEITARGIKDQSKLATVYSGIDLGKFKKEGTLLRNELGLSPDQFLIGNTSALADHKDYFTFLDVAEKVVNQNERCFFVIIGDGPLSKEIHEYAKAKKIDKNLFFTGFRNDVPNILRELDLFLITSKTEGLGTSILDAFACQLPVVATAAGGIPELVEDQKTGILCPVKDINALKNAVLKLVENKGLRDRLAENAFQKVQKFSKRETAKNTLAIYQSLSA